MENDLDDDWMLQHGRWIAKTNKVLKGKPGRSALQDLERVLLAMPHKRLIEGRLVETGGENQLEAERHAWAQRLIAKGKNQPALKSSYVRECGMCVVGAWVYRRKVDEGMTPRAAWKSLKSLGQPNRATRNWKIAYDDSDGYDNFQRTLDVGVAELGITRTLAQIVSYENDEGAYYKRSPEQRYAYVLDFVRRAIAGQVWYG